jgi:D-alanine transaminase
MVSLTPLPQTIAYLAGEFIPLSEAKISPLDRGFLFADAIYEVIPVYNGWPFLFKEHIERLERSLRELSIPNPHSTEEWAHIIRELIAKNGSGDLSIYLQVSRGVEALRNHAIPSHCTPTVFLMAQALPALSPSLLSEGAKAITTEDLRWLRCDIKSVNLLPNVLAKTQAVAHDALETLMIRDGLLTEGSSSSALIVTQGELIAPEYSRELLPGTTRNLCVELAKSAQIPVSFKPITREQLFHADELMIGFATRGIVPITQLDGKAIGTGKPGAVFKRIRQLFDERRLTPMPY